MQIELNTTVCVSLNNNESPFDAQERLQTVLSENNMSAIKTDNIVLHDDKGTPLHFYELWCQEHETPGGINDFDMCIIGAREPTVEEANAFCAIDLLRDEHHPLHVTRVSELTLAEAMEEYNIEGCANWPIFY